MYIGDTLSVKEQKNLKVTLSYHGSTLPTSFVTIENLSAVIIYSQN